MVIRQEHINLALGDDVWSFGNNVLYNLCRDYPGHKEPDVVIAKVWLIGRSYAAAVERRKSNTKSWEIANEAFYEKKVAPALISSDIDGCIKHLQQFKRVDRKNVSMILETHKHLVDVLSKITGQNKRSLASKYLHFHLPNLFYLYDNRAANGFRKLKPRYRPGWMPEGAFDSTYSNFSLKLLHLQEEIARDFRQQLTPRQIDRMLLKVASQKT